MKDAEIIRKGIAAYSREQKVILRLLRRRGKFTADEFDRWFRNKDRNRPLSGRGITGDSFILGMGINGGNEWAKYLDLMQHMMAINMIDAKTIDGVVTYLPA